MLNRCVLTPMLAAGLAAFAMLWLISPVAAQEAPREECSDCLESDVLTEAQIADVMAYLLDPKSPVNK